MSTLRQTVKITKFKTQFGVQDKSYQFFFFPAGIWSQSCVLSMPQVADEEAPTSSGSPSKADPQVGWTSYIWQLYFCLLFSSPREQRQTLEWMAESTE